MSMSLKEFLRVLLGLAAAPGVSRAGVGAGASPPPLGTAGGWPPAGGGEGWLREWAGKPRLPVWEGGDELERQLVQCVRTGARVRFRYMRGSEPGGEREVSPGLVFRVEGHGARYMAGYCHGRGAERVFRLDGMAPAGPPRDGPAAAGLAAACPGRFG